MVAQWDIVFQFYKEVHIVMKDSLGDDEGEELSSISITRHETVGYSLFSNKCLQGYGTSCTVSFHTAARLGRGCVCVHGQ